MTTFLDHAKRSAPRPVPLATLVEGWLADGVISPEQARQMTAQGPPLVEPPVAAHRVATRPPVEPPERHPASTLAVEALGYLGGVVVLVSSILIMNLYWQDLSDLTRALVLGGASLALLAAGLATPARLGDVGIRLRSVLWVSATAAFGVFAILLTQNVLDIEEEHSAVLTTAATAAVAAGLWFLHRHLLQQMVTVLALMLTAGASIHDMFPAHDSLPGVGVWAVATVWLLLGWAAVVQPRWAVVPIAAFGVVIGSLMTLPADAGFVLAIGSVSLVVTLAVLTADLPLLAVGAFGTLNVLPAAVNEWFPDSDAVPFALLGVGLLLVLLAVWTARRRSVQPHEPRRDWGHLPVDVALVCTGAVLLAATAMVLVVGLG
ncbi:DUF2157 domain-containing protein [Nocardioides agariphilus]|uniref:DUF2157 domain-containing protein n=1 Tax=Nocardioides agariphilus TaxID=433664 RepID=A0A930YJR0_9ACTN|nr:DUF2157 domain-containing protein [Nocardioides agariphilus]MBF4769572.1 DUF2157 domain-containing protein [Nocardioides agariphilus]